LLRVDFFQAPVRHRMRTAAVVMMSMAPAMSFQVTLSVLLRKTLTKMKTKSGLIAERGETITTVPYSRARSNVSWPRRVKQPEREKRNHGFCLLDSSSQAYSSA
jgi:hypothetical protein